MASQGRPGALGGFFEIGSGSTTSQSKRGASEHLGRHSGNAGAARARLKELQ
jgi:hypothetical protein